MSVNQRIKALIEELNFNANSFSKEIGLANNATISKIVRGAGLPSYSTLEKIKEAFPQVNMNWVIADEGEMLMEDTNDWKSISKKQEKTIDILLDTLDRVNKGKKIT